MPSGFDPGSRVDFLNVSLKYDTSVLTPRLETESLVLGVARFFSSRESPEVILDIGTGSGAIIVALHSRFPKARLLAVDISDAALLVAQGNASDNSVPVDFYRGNLLDPFENPEMLESLAGRRVLIVANLPYIGDNEEIGEDVRLEDPAIALYGGGIYGFERIHELLEQSKKLATVTKSLHVALEF